jgi:uncharacterized protein GlcG (DUF336 family)
MGHREMSEETDRVMTVLTLAEADRVVDAALRHGQEQGLAPLTVAVLDTGGHLLVLKRSDGSGILRADIAVGKAWGVLGMGFGGRELQRRAEQMPAFFTALASMSGGRMVPVPGGVLIRRDDGRLVGAVGISGDTSVNDEECAVHGVRAAGLVPDTGDD